MRIATGCFIIKTVILRYKVMRIATMCCALILGHYFLTAIVFLLLWLVGTHMYFSIYRFVHFVNR